jgi:branched-chain amino acid transport system substrate-binding protein
MAIRKVHDIGWKPVHYLNNHSTSIASVLTPAGLEKSVDIISTQYIKDPRDSRWTDDKGVKDYLAFMAEYYPDGDPMDWSNQFSYASTAAIAHVLKQCQDNLTRENVMKQAANIKDLQLDIFIPGIKINTGPSDFIPVESLQFVRFDGKQWVPFGGVVGK